MSISIKNPSINSWFTLVSDQNTKKVFPIFTSDFSAWKASQNDYMQKWIEVNGFTAKSGTFCILPNNLGEVDCVLVGLADANDYWAFGDLSKKLPSGSYEINAQNFSAAQLERAAIAWGLGSYSFSKYKKNKELATQLVFPVNTKQNFIINFVEAIFLTRDLINMPNYDLGPEELAAVASNLAHEFSAEVKQIIGEDLLKQNFPGIYAVGKGSLRAPRLVHIKWGNDDSKPLITLVGKGVCFDTGGWDLKPSSGMLLMREDMGGAAHALALARLIMQENLPVRLHVILPLVENILSSDAYKPGDIIKMRNGKTVSVFNTDAEGRIILGDALAYACEFKPNLLLDFATLTGAARVALGNDITAMFVSDDKVADGLNKSAVQEKDPLWRMPLYEEYFQELDSCPMADFYNCTDSRYGGAITAALFLQQFVEKQIPWAHFDIAAWNVKSKPGRPEGGDALCLRGILQYLIENYQ